ncbi:hypothetical protein [Streptomyces rimosus]|uniref:hypothetical protein n=1 Tax=Streptomyces rimosus TaxID=1927 RepID=UPI00379A1C22
MNGGLSPGSDPEIHRRRDTVERRFSHLEGFREIVTGYDKTATSYEAAITLASYVLRARSV